MMDKFLVSQINSTYDYVVCITQSVLNDFQKNIYIYDIIPKLAALILQIITLKLEVFRFFRLVTSIWLIIWLTV